MIAFPLSIPNSLEQYKAKINSAKGYLRDYSLIVPRDDLKTLEFRSACSQENIGRILELVSLRFAISLISSKEELAIDRNLSLFRKIFYEACETGMIDKTVLMSDFKILENISHRLPKYMYKEFTLFLDRAAPV